MLSYRPHRLEDRSPVIFSFFEQSKTSGERAQHYNIKRELAPPLLQAIRTPAVCTLMLMHQQARGQQPCARNSTVHSHAGP